MLRCAICDDDYAFLLSFQQRLAGYCAPHGAECECSLFITPSEFLLAATADEDSPPPFDIMFLNVDLGWWDGINIARTLRRAGIKTLIIFVSNHLRFAPDGYSVGAFRYLLKDELDEKFPEAMDAAFAQLQRQSEIIEVKCGKDIYPVPLGNILYIESDKRTVIFALQNYSRKSLTTYRKLSDLEAELTDKGFLRVHKSFLVNMRYVDSIKNYVVTMKNGESMQTSRQNYKELVEAFRRFSGNPDNFS